VVSLEAGRAARPRMAPPRRGPHPPRYPRRRRLPPGRLPTEPGWRRARPVRGRGRERDGGCARARCAGRAETPNRRSRGALHQTCAETWGGLVEEGVIGVGCGGRRYGTPRGSRTRLPVTRGAVPRDEHPLRRDRRDGRDGGGMGAGRARRARRVLRGRLVPNGAAAASDRAALDPCSVG
jgi:hypothetical protein